MSDSARNFHAVYVGSFDPLTLGHLDIIERGARLFSRLTVGIGINPEKAALFTPEERLQLTRRVVASYANVDVRCFTGLTVDFVRACGASVILRGIRTLSDMESEFSLALANRSLAPDVETVFLMAAESHSHISSSLIKQIAQLGGPSAAERLQAFVPAEIIAPLCRKFGGGKQ
ncbi:MAG: pantetheine-phosphate adenylyltransferase [Planctomycetota bacterium]|nr:MAG: pantetheine-phosphate adenylyltransferase [Planctomycetota bacterium]